MVNFFYLVGVLASVKQLRKRHQILLSRYFRGELRQRIWGRVCPRKAPEGPAWLQEKRAATVGFLAFE